MANSKAMAKLIKKGDSDDHTSVTSMPARPEPRHGTIIDRDTHEARQDAQQIRERAQAKAKEVIDQAQAGAEVLLQQAQADADARRSQAHGEGFAVGHAEGVAQLNEAVLRASLRLQELEGELVPQLTTLAVSIARRILGKELQFHPDLVVDIVRQVLAEKARQRREITLRIHPDDAQAIREHRASLAEMLSRCKEIAIHEDAQVARHGVVVETEAGTIDAQLDTQLAAFERVLQAVDA